MSRRDYQVTDRYEERESDIYRRPRREREHDDIEVDITRSRQPESRREETVVTDRRTDRGPRQPDFLREDYGRSSSKAQLVVREDLREDDTYSGRRSDGRGKSRQRDDRVETDKFTFEERETSNRGPPYPRSGQSEIDVSEKEEVIYRERPRSRRPPPREQRDEEEIDVTIRRDERSRSRRPPPREQRDEEEIDVTIRRDERSRSRRPPPREQRGEEEVDITIRRDEGGESRPRPRRGEEQERDFEEITIRRDERSRSRPRRGEEEERDFKEIRFRRGGDSERPPQSPVVDREEIDIRERRSQAPARSPAPPRNHTNREEIDIDIRERRDDRRGREVVKEEIDIRERSTPAPRQRSMSRGALVARKDEEWIVRRERTPPPRDYEKEEIIIRRREKSPSPEPEPPREPTPEPPSPPPEPVYRPPIIQEVITHHRHIDHGFERARSPTPPPPPSPPSPVKEKEEDLEIEIRRSGTRNGKSYSEDIVFERDVTERKEAEPEIKRDASKRRSVSIHTNRKSASPSRSRHYAEEEESEANYYNRRASSRGYPGEAWNGTTRDWGLLDIPPGTERVRMDGAGGGREEITWQRYNGDRRERFSTGGRAYESEWGNGYPPPRAPSSRRESRETKEEVKITERRTMEEKPRKRDKMWTEVTKDLVVKEAILELGYDYEETDEFFYVMDYLRYVSGFRLKLLTLSTTRETTADSFPQEDVVRLVEATEDIKRERRDRLREIQWEREESERRPKMLPAPIPPPPTSRYDERIYEREYIIDRDGRRRRRH